MSLVFVYPTTLSQRRLNARGSKQWVTLSGGALPLLSIHRIHGPRFMDQESGDRVHGHWFHEPCHPPLSRGWVRLLLLCVLHTVDIQRVIECGGIALHSDDSLGLAELPDRRSLLTFRKGSNGLVVGLLLSGVVLL